jgi:TolA-binding protein
MRAGRQRFKAKTLFGAWGGLLLAIVWIVPVTVRAQNAGSKADLLWKDAQVKFAARDYPTTISDLKQVIVESRIQLAATQGVTSLAQIDDSSASALAAQQWLEPTYYLLGAAYYNSKDWDTAIATFKKYQVLFPHSTRITEVIFSQAQANIWGDHLDEGIAQLNTLLPLPDYHTKALFILVDAYRRAKNPADAIAVLEKERIVPNMPKALLGKVNTRLLGLYLETRANDKALALIHDIEANITQVPDITEFNGMATRLGDSYLEAKQTDNALDCYRRVRDNAQIEIFEQEQIASLQKQRAMNLDSIRGNPLASGNLQEENQAIDAQVKKDNDSLQKYQALPPVIPPLFLRIGRAYSVDARYWEAAVVYRELMRRYPKCPEFESAVYGSIVAFDQAKQNERALALCKIYLTNFPNGQYADSVGYLQGALAYDAEDFDHAIAYFQDAMRNPKAQRREQMELIIADIKLRQIKFDEAIACYDQYLKDYPAGHYIEPAQYRTALALVFAGKVPDATTALHAYLDKYPEGTYAADAEYRLAFLKFSDKKYEDTLTDCKAWQKKYGEAGPAAEVLSLMGDCYASLDNNDDAVKTYQASYRLARTPEVLNYSIFAAAKILEKQAKYDNIIAMFQDFIKNNPDHPTVVSALLWIGKADIKLGKIDEARKFLADTAKKYINDPGREADDEMITQLALLYAHHNDSPATTIGATTPEVDPADALVAILTSPMQEAPPTPTAKARVLFARAELARIQRNSEKEGEILMQIAANNKPEDLSPLILGQVGDVLLQNSKPDQAMPFYNYLLDNYGNSTPVDYAYAGLGQIAYDQKNYKVAEDYYSKALSRGLASNKLKEITLGEAQSLMALQRYDDARALFEEVASTRAWRGEATALSVYSLGEIQMQKGKFAEANAYFQRVFVAYQKYPDVQAKAYLRSGEAFEQLGMFPQAVNTYNEMLRNPNLVTLPETNDARARLSRLAQK